MQWNSSNLEARFPALKEDSFLLSFLGLQLFSLGAESGREAGLGPRGTVHPAWALPLAQCWQELGARAGFQRGGVANTGCLLGQGCRQCVNRHLDGSAMCAQFLEQKLGCHGCYCALCALGAAQGRGVATGTAACLWQRSSVGLPAAKAELVCVCLQKALYTSPQSGLLERQRLAGKCKTGSKLFQTGLMVGSGFD